MSELSKNTTATESIKKDTSGMVEAWRDFIGFKSVIRILIIMIITLSALIGAIAVIITLFKTGNLPDPNKAPAAPAVVAPVPGPTR